MGALATVIGAVAFAITEHVAWAWLGMFALAALVVSLGIELWRVQHAAVSQSRAVVDRTVAEGRKMLAMPTEAFTGNLWLEWQERTAQALREHVGVPEAHEFRGASAGGSGLRGMAQAQVNYLEGLRKKL